MKTEFGGQTALIIEDANPKEILSRLSAFGVKAAHFNNGTFTLPADKMTPTMLASHRYIADTIAAPDDAMIVAVNSDKSMRASYKGKPNEGELNAALESEIVRARKVTDGLDMLFQHKRPIVAVFYDEETPLELYTALHDAGFGMKSLHKWGFGTSADDKPIIGGHLFEKLLAFPLPFDEKPVMHGDTRVSLAADRRPDEVTKLTEKIGPHGRPYITPGNEILFPYPLRLHKYAAKDVLPIGANGPSSNWGP